MALNNTTKVVESSERQLRELTLRPAKSTINEHHEIRRISSIELDYNEFYWTHMQYNNWPVILTDVANNWECSLHWKTQKTPTPPTNDNEKPTATINFDYLKNKIGNCRVPVADCNLEYFNSHSKIEMDFFDFLTKWQHKIAVSATQPQEANSNDATLNTVNKTTNTKLYLKDWHLKTLLPDYDFYCVPKHFASDWLNEQLVAQGGDDYRFVYMGPKDTWTPFHADVFGSYSWSTNIFGCKKWLMLPPGEELKLTDRLGNLPFQINEQLLEQHNVRYFILLQTENEAIFVPSGWYHQVYNITDTISVNHNWFNACNITRIWNNLQKEMQRVLAEIEDCRQMDNFEAHCQTMLRASFGLNYLDFLEHLEFIAQRRLAAININCSSNNRISTNNSNNQTNDDVVQMTTTTTSSDRYILFDKYILNDYHVEHDLKSIQKVLQLMLLDAIICDNRSTFYRRSVQLLQQIEQHLNANEK